VGSVLHLRSTSTATRSWGAPATRSTRRASGLPHLAVGPGSCRRSNPVRAPVRSGQRRCPPAPWRRLLFSAAPRLAAAPGPPPIAPRGAVVYTVARCDRCGFLYQRPRCGTSTADCYPYTTRSPGAFVRAFRSRGGSAVSARSGGRSPRISATPSGGRGAGLLTRPARAPACCGRLRLDCRRVAGCGASRRGCCAGGALGSAAAPRLHVAGVRGDAAAGRECAPLHPQVHTGDLQAGAVRGGRVSL